MASMVTFHAFRSTPEGECVMSLDRSDVQRIAHLARLSLDERQVDAYLEDLNAILQLVERLQAVDTDGVGPMAHPQDLAQRLRADEVTETNQRDKFQALAPAVENGLYLVPKVIE